MAPAGCFSIRVSLSHTQVHTNNTPAHLHRHVWRQLAVSLYVYRDCRSHSRGHLHHVCAVTILWYLCDIAFGNASGCKREPLAGVGAVWSLWNISTKRRLTFTNVSRLQTSRVYKYLAFKTSRDYKRFTFTNASLLQTSRIYKYLAFTKISRLQTSAIHKRLTFTNSSRCKRMPLVGVCTEAVLHIAAK
jgi:hypothetical protein